MGIAVTVPGSPPRQRRDKVRLPGSTAVVRERLLEMVRGGRDVRPDLPDQDRAALHRGLLVIELAAAVLELADQPRADHPLAAGGGVEAPLPGLRIVEEQQQVLDLPAGPVGPEFFELSVAVPDLPDI